MCNIYLDNIRLLDSNTTDVKSDSPAISNFEISPNPANDIILLQSNDGFNNIEITDLAGSIVYSSILPGEVNSVSLNVSDFVSGN